MVPLKNISISFQKGAQNPKILHIWKLYLTLEIVKQMYKIQWFHPITVSNTLLYQEKYCSSHLLLICTCPTFTCRHVTIVTCFALRCPLFAFDYVFLYIATNDFWH